MYGLSVRTSKGSNFQRVHCSTLRRAMVIVACATSTTFAQQHSSVERAEFAANWGLHAIGAEHAHALGVTGRGVTLGIADDAFQFTHPEFAGRILYPNPFPQFPVPGVPIPDHGTHVTGLAAAARDGFGMMGVAPEASLVLVTAYETIGYPPPGDWIQELIDQNVKVMNGSFGPFPAPMKKLPNGQLNPHYRVVPVLATTVPVLNYSADIVRRLSHADVVMVFAAGNAFKEQPLTARIPSGVSMFPMVTPALTAAGDLYQVVNADSDPNNPDTWNVISSTDPELMTLDGTPYRGSMIAVVAVDQHRQIASFSNRCGAAADWCMAAPGTDLLSSVPMNNYHAESGTSMSAPMVSGAATLLRQAFPYMSARQIIELLLTTAIDLGDTATFGHGLLDIATAIRGSIEFGSNAIFSHTFSVDTQGHDSIWSNNISGSGGLQKSGAGRLILSGHNTYSGPTTVAGGTLQLDGSLISTLHVQRDATFSGIGGVGHTTVEGTLTPGRPFGTLYIRGDLTLQDTSRLNIHLGSQQQTAVLNVSNNITVQPEALLQLIVVDRITLDHPYLVVQATHIDGNWRIPPANWLFMQQTVSRRSQAGFDYMSVTYQRNQNALQTYAKTANQTAVAHVIDHQQSGNEPFDTLMLSTDAMQLPMIFEQLAGEIYAEQKAILLNNGHQTVQSILQHRQPFSEHSYTPVVNNVNDQTHAWMDIQGQRDYFSATHNNLGSQATSQKLLVGLGHAIHHSLEVGGIFAVQQIELNQAYSHSILHTYQVGLFATQRHEQLRASTGLIQTWHDGITQRSLPRRIDLTHSDLSATSLQPGHSLQLFSDLGVRMPLTPGTWIEPFVSTNYVWLHTGEFTETGSHAALSGQASDNSKLSSTVGLRSQTHWRQYNIDWQLNLLLGWQHDWKHPQIASTHRFESGDSFTVYSTAVSKDALAIEVGIAAQLNVNSKLRIYYTGQIGQGHRSQSLQAQINWQF